MLNKIMGMIAGVTMLGCGWAQAQMQTSPVFIFAYSFNSGGWNARETAAVNTPAIQENFKVEAVLNGVGYTSWGPTFSDGVITTGGAGEYVADVGSFSLALTGQYLTPTPGRQYKLCFQVESLSMWGSIDAAVNPEDGTLNFNETRPGHLQSQSPATVYYRDGNRYFYSWAFSKSEWNPDDGWALNTTAVTRTFNLSSSGNVVIDGLEISGTIQVMDLADGDANGDGRVDVGDLGILAAHYGTTGGAAWEQGDFNGDNTVDVGDLGILAAHYGMGSGYRLDFNKDVQASGLSVERDLPSVDASAVSALSCGSTTMGLTIGVFLAVMGLSGVCSKG